LPIPENYYDDLEAKTDLSTEDVERLKAISTVKIESKPGPGIILMAVDLDQPYLKDKRVRQAILSAIDRAGIVNTVNIFFGMLRRAARKGCQQHKRHNRHSSKAI